ncbi:Cation/H+ exchanger [Russula brevipes]|nr:Cation/H+ exchanger [Russula brevipes]
MRKHLIAIKYNLLSLKVAETVRYRVYLRPHILRSHQQLYMNEVVFGTGFGVLLGPHVLNIFDPRSWTGVTNLLTREVMRIVLAIGLFGIGVRLPTRYMAEHAKSLLIMVVPTMAFGWLISAAFIHVLFPKLDFVSSLVISACLTPTDPILSAALIGQLSEREDGTFAENKVPLEVRQLLVAESASNDGLAYPFLSIAIYLTTESSRGTAFEKWIVIGWLYQVVLGTVFGAVIGLLFSRLLEFARRRGFFNRESYIAEYTALALFTAGATGSLGNDDLLAAFAAGSAISWDDHFNRKIENYAFSILDLVLNCICFIYIGAWLPFDQFDISELGITPWRLVLLMLVILTLRRIPFIFVIYKLIPNEVSNWREALLCGYFGPMGVSAIFVSTLAQSRLAVPQTPPLSQQDLLATALQPIVSFVVLGSIFIRILNSLYSRERLFMCALL